MRNKLQLARSEKTFTANSVIFDCDVNVTFNDIIIDNNIVRIFTGARSTNNESNVAFKGRMNEKSKYYFNGIENTEILYNQKVGKSRDIHALCNYYNNTNKYTLTFGGPNYDYNETYFRTNVDLYKMFVFENVLNDEDVKLISDYLIWLRYNPDKNNIRMQS